MITVSTRNATSVLGAPLHEHSKVLQLRQAMRLPWLAGCAAAALLCATDADALELGEASVKSYLGDRLHIEVPYKVGANERLAPGCVSLVPADAARGALPAFTAAQSINVGNGIITLRGEQPVREPLIGMNVRIACKSAPHIVRSYQMFVDPRPAIVSAPAPTAQPVVRAQQSRATAIPATPQARGLAGASIEQGSSYTVQRGDTLSGIAARIAARQTGLWSAAEAIHAQNPAAFLNGDMNLLAEGAVLSIPQLGVQTADSQVTTNEPGSTDTWVAPAAPVSAAEVNSALESLARTASDRVALETEPTPIVEAAQAPAFSVDPSKQTSPASAENIAEGTASEPFDVRSPFVVRDPEPIAATPAPLLESTTDAAARTTPGWISGLVAIGAAMVLTLILMLFRRRRQTPEELPEFLDAPLPDAGTTAPTARLRKLEIDDPAESTWAEDSDSGSFAEVETASDFSSSLTGVEPESAAFALDASTNAEALDLAFGSEEPVADVDLDIGKADPVSTSETGVTMTRNTTDESDITMAELDLLTRDYEAELTATQQLNEELATAVANLRKSDAQQTRQDLDDGEEVDTAETAFFEDAEIPDELRWDDRTRANAQLMTEEILDDATFTMSTEIDGETVEMPSRDEPTLEMPGKDVIDDEIYTGTDLLDDAPAALADDHDSTAVLDDNDEDVEWEAFTRAANSQNR